AVHLACQSLLAFESDMALAGGVSVHLPLTGGYRHEDGGILSPDGHCRPFDAAAEGTVSSDGAGVVVLKRLSDAIADGDTIHAVLAPRHREIPPTLRFRRPNPQVDFGATPFYVNSDLVAVDATPMRAGVSSFGSGGTNVHVVLEEFRGAAREPSRGTPELLL